MSPYHSQYQVVVLHTQSRSSEDTRHQNYGLLDATFDPTVVSAVLPSPPPSQYMIQYPLCLLIGANSNYLPPPLPSKLHSSSDAPTDPLSVEAPPYRQQQ